MTEEQFIKEIQDEITGSGALPVVVNTQEIKRIISQASRYFFESYEFAVQQDHYILKKEQFDNAQFRKTRTMILPECVISVISFKEINGIGRLGNIDRDFGEDRLIASELFLSDSTLGSDIVLRTAQYSFFDLAKSFFVEQISYDFNKNTKQLKVLGRDPKYDCYLGCWIQIGMDKLFNDYNFLRWCTATAKLSFARIVGTYPMALPGGVTINSDMLRSEGETELEKIVERMAAENVPDYFLQYH